MGVRRARGAFAPRLEIGIMKHLFLEKPEVGILIAINRADFSTVGLYCVTIIWQQIYKGSLYIAVAGVLLHETVERRHLGR